MLKLENVSKSFGGLRVISDVSLSFDARALSAIVGPNGAGKTTLFNLICGAFAPTSGEIQLDGETLVGRKDWHIARRGIARAFQVASLFPTFNVLDSFAAAASSPTFGLGAMFTPFPTAAGTRRASEIVELLGLNAVASTPVARLSHGDQKMVDLGIALCADPKVILLDEPTAGMGPEERWHMMETVQKLWSASNVAVLFIEHDMDIVFSIARDVTVLAQGSVLVRGDPKSVRGDPRVIEAYLGSHAAEQVT